MSDTLPNNLIKKYKFHIYRYKWQQNLSNITKY